MSASGKCRVCHKPVDFYAVILWNDLTGWCSNECFLKEGNEERAKLREARRHAQLQKYGRILDEDDAKLA